MMLSISMMILIMNSLPFQFHSDNYKETLNEIVIIFVLYHVILASDYVPASELKLKELNAYSMIYLISSTVVFLLFLIIITPVLKYCIQRIKLVIETRDVKII